MTTSSPLCQLYRGCMGCCGHDFPSTERIQKAIDSNTKEFVKANPQTKEDFLKFRDRRYKMDLRNGVCRNLIAEQGCFLCPLHPTRHENEKRVTKEDLRKGHCDINYLCRTAKEFQGWSKEKQKDFLQFVDAKKLTNLEYSMKMDKDFLLKEFLDCPFRSQKPL